MVVGEKGKRRCNDGLRGEENYRHFEVRATAGETKTKYVKTPVPKRVAAKSFTSTGRKGSK